MDADVAVVIVTHGAWAWTRRALTALAAHTPEPHELVVVDNASPDGTLAGLAAEFPAVRVIANAANAGFGCGCNQGARAVAAPFVVFLNSDALVEPGWLAPLRAVVAGRPDVAAAVPCVLDLDGRVQCAGALLGRDGTVLEHGNGAAPDDPAVAFPRAVDFGPAACLLADRARFLAAGGFSDVYAPAYYEDADLCLALAAAGGRTVYVPAARVRHVRYASGGPAAAAALSARNRTRFARRWGDALDGRPASLHPPSPHTALAARDAPADGRVLVAGAPAAGSAGAAWLHALLAARPWARVTLAAGGADAEHWLPHGVEVLAAPAAEVLAARPCHYDAVAGDEIRASLLAAHQPQAVRLVPGAARPDLAAAGLRPAASA